MRSREAERKGVRSEKWRVGGRGRERGRREGRGLERS